MTLFKAGSTFIDKRWEFLALKEPRLKNLFYRTEALPKEQDNTCNILWKNNETTSSSEYSTVNFFLNSDRSNVEKYQDLKNYLLESKKYTESAGASGTKVSTTNNNPKGNEVYYRGNLKKDDRGNLVKDGFGVSMGDNQAINIRTLRLEQNGSYKVEGDIIQVFSNGLIIKGKPLIRQYTSKSSKAAKGQQQRNIKNENFEIDFSQDVVISKKEGQQFTGKVKARVLHGNKMPVDIEELSGTIIENIDGYHFEAQYPPRHDGLLEGKILTAYGVESYGCFNENYALEGVGVKRFGDPKDPQDLDSWELKGTWSNGQPIDRELYQFKIAGKEFEAVYQEKENRFFAEKVSIKYGEDYNYQGSLEIPLKDKSQEELKFNEYFQGLELKPLNGKLKFDTKDASGLAVFAYKNGELANKYKICAGSKNVSESFSKNSTAKSSLLELNLKNPIDEKIRQSVESRLHSINKSSDFKLSNLELMLNSLVGTPFKPFSKTKKILVNEVKDVLHLIKNTKKDFRKESNSYAEFNLNNGYIVRKYPNRYYEYIKADTSLVELAFDLSTKGNVLRASKFTENQDGTRSCLVYCDKSLSSDSGENQIFISQAFKEKDRKIQGSVITEDKDYLQGNFSRSSLKGDFVLDGKYERFQKDGTKTIVKYKNNELIKEVNPAMQKENRQLRLQKIANSATGWVKANAVPNTFVLLMIIALAYEGMTDSRSVTELDDFPVSFDEQNRIIETYEGIKKSSRELVIANVVRLFKAKSGDKATYREAFRILDQYGKKERAFHNFVILADIKDEKYDPPVKLKLINGLLIPYQTTEDDKELQYTKRLVQRMRDSNRKTKKQIEFYKKRFNHAGNNDFFYRKIKSQFEAYQKQQRKN